MIKLMYSGEREGEGGRGREREGEGGRGREGGGDLIHFQAVVWPIFLIVFRSNATAAHHAASRSTTQHHAATHNNTQQLATRGGQYALVLSSSPSALSRSSYCLLFSAHSPLDVDHPPLLLIMKYHHHTLHHLISFIFNATL